MENIPFSEIAMSVKDNPLGLLSLAVILFSIITLKFFKDASDKIKLIIFLFLVLGLSGLVYAGMKFKMPSDDVSRSSETALKTRVSGNLQAIHGDIEFSVSVTAKEFTNGKVEGSYTYDRIGENFRGEIQCLNISKTGFVTVAGPVKTFDQGQPVGWKIMDIRNTTSTPGGIRVYSANKDVALEKCRIPGNGFPAKLIGGQISVEAT